MEGDDDELEDSDCLPLLLEDVQSVHHTLHMCKPAVAFIQGWRVFFFTQCLQLCVIYSRAASIQGRRKYGLCMLPWYPQSGGGGMAGDYSPHQSFQCYIVKHGTFVCYRSYCTCSAGIILAYTVQSAVARNTPAYTCSQIPYIE